MKDQAQSQSQERQTTILCAGPGLGFYIPGALLARQLRHERLVDLVVIEGLLSPEKQEIIRRARQAFHRDFRVALMGQRVVHDMTPDLRPDAVQHLLSRWAAEGRRHFIVFSGFWGPIMARYLREYAPGATWVDYCHVDAAPSSSWSLVRERPPHARDVWFLSWADRRLHSRLEVSGEAPLPWEARGERLLAHGGGWGMGTHLQRSADLDPSQVSLDVLCYEPADLEPRRPQWRYFLLPPGWFPWSIRPDQSLFPPLGIIDESGAARFVENHEYPEIFRLIRAAPAMISKPGGGTLIDSLAAATPLLLLEPFGEYEQKNGLLWKEWGFAMDLASWVSGGCRREDLQRMHDRLVAARARVRNYAAVCCGAEEARP